MAKLMIGQPAPIFVLEDLDGRVVGLRDFLGQTVLVNFWSAECPHVERVDRALAAWQDRLALLCIDSNASEPAELIRQAAALRGLRRVLLDPDQTIADRYGAEITPHLFLIDAGGILRYQGAFDDVSFRQKEPTRGYCNGAVEALLAGQPIPVAETAPFGCTIVRQFPGADL